LSSVSQQSGQENALLAHQNQNCTLWVTKMFYIFCLLGLNEHKLKITVLYIRYNFLSHQTKKRFLRLVEISSVQSSIQSQLGKTKEKIQFIALKFIRIIIPIKIEHAYDSIQLKWGVATQL